MSYFNKKFDVLDIKLTPYGRHLLQNGKLMPKYYAFFDDDVIYDSAMAGFTENNSQIKNRIMLETPVLRPHYSFKGLEDEQGKDQPFPTTQHDKTKKPNADERSKFLQYSLGTSDPTKSKAPAWNMVSLKKEISGSATQLSSSNYQNVNIPQIDFEINYTMSVDNISNSQDTQGLRSTPSLQVSKVYDDGTFLNVEPEQVLLHLIEENAFLYGDALELEVFMFETTGSGDQKTFTEELKPLMFYKTKDQIQNGILVGEAPDPLETMPGNNDLLAIEGRITPKNVEYYFDCRLDKQIPLADLCDGLKRVEGLALDLDLDVECPDDLPTSTNIYRSAVTKEDIEDCD